MEKRPKRVSKETDRLMISKRITRSSSKLVKIPEQFPVDLIIVILSKLPAKFIAKLCCVSKFWSSILRGPHFTSLFLTVSSSCPRLLFCVAKKGNLHFFSTPQPLNPDKNSSPLTTDYHMCFPVITCSYSLLDSVNGLLCTSNINVECGCNDSKVMIYNPSTGQSKFLPIMRGQMDFATTYLGYDPINQQYKMLCLSMRIERVIEHEVLTLGTENPTWRRIACSLSLRFTHSPICINGVLYYLGTHVSRQTHVSREILICFDVRSEKYKFTETDHKVDISSRLINYKGKLGVFPSLSFTGKTSSLELLVLDDVEKNKWSQHIFVLPPLWKDIVADMTLYILGMTGNGEFVFSRYGYEPFYIFFYNVKKNTIARVRIEGMESRRNPSIWTFINHVENVKLI